MRAPVNFAQRPTSDADRIARYLHLVIELPKDVVDAGNLYACMHLAAYKREQLVDSLALFMKPAEQHLPPGDRLLLAKLLRRALRQRHGRHARFSTGDPRDDLNAMLTVLMAGVGPLLIYHFQSSPDVRRYVRLHADVWSEEQGWLADLGDRPLPLGRAGSAEYREAARASGGMTWAWSGGDRDGLDAEEGDSGDGGFGDGDWGFD